MTDEKIYNRAERREMRKKGILVRFRENGEQVVCYHLENEWCQECIAEPQEVEQVMPDGSISKGYLITNL